MKTFPKLTNLLYFFLLVTGINSYSQTPKNKKTENSFILFEDVDFSVRLPKEPGHETKIATDINGDTCFYTIYLSGVKNAYMITKFSYSNPEVFRNLTKDTTSISKLFMGALTGGAEMNDFSIESIVKNYKKTPFWKCKLKEKRSKSISYLKILLAKNTLYILNIAGEPKNITAKEVEAFYNSFVIK